MLLKKLEYNLVNLTSSVHRSDWIRASLYDSSGNMIFNERIWVHSNSHMWPVCLTTVNQAGQVYSRTLLITLVYYWTRSMLTYTLYTYVSHKIIFQKFCVLWEMEINLCLVVTHAMWVNADLQNRKEFRIEAKPTDKHYLTKIIILIVGTRHL